MTGSRKLQKLNQEVELDVERRGEANSAIPAGIAEQVLNWRKDSIDPKARLRQVPPKAWRRYFPAEIEVLAELSWSKNGAISIDDLQALSNSDIGNRELFIATLMWGRGPKNGRMMPFFRFVLAHPAIDETLSKTRAEILEGRPEGAYRLWRESGIKWIHEPWFTKWFFVCGLGEKRCGLQPLVLDGRVWRSLKALKWPNQERAGKKISRDRASVYLEYLTTIHLWANEISRKGLVTPLEVEQFLFDKDGKF